MTCSNMSSFIAKLQICKYFPFDTFHEMVYKGLTKTMFFFLISHSIS